MEYLKNVTTIRYEREKCIGCGRCIEVCPHAVFSISERKADLVAKDACMECGACARNCISSAISVDAGVGCAQALVYSLLTGKPPSCDCDSGSSSGTCC